MANKTVKEAVVVHGTNPQYLIEKMIRTRIYESRYWKEDCFGLSAADVFDKAIQLRFMGGVYGGNIKATPFLALTLKLLQIQPDKDIVIAFIGRFGEKYKYLRALGAFYLRLTASSLETWKYLEPLYHDFRKLRVMDRMGNFSVMHVDEFVDMLLREERVFDVILPRISKRRVHEEANELDLRTSALDQDLDQEEEEEEEETVHTKTQSKDDDRDIRRRREQRRDRSPRERDKRRDRKSSPEDDRRRDRKSSPEDDRRRDRKSSPEDDRRTLSRRYRRQTPSLTIRRLSRAQCRPLPRLASSPCARTLDRGGTRAGPPSRRRPRARR